ncbi:hypothetical protein Astex_2275 [Asticcacaulis excentricus CB 48]|uniref:Glycosyltransferase n=2 Tax=Asticcacaulis excentricus TaxID=78587 RepID=E8RMP9_ASTEC|nr:hypothetical protein Astex_2275 [Asticcacaulis excentricus CB 48]
MKKRSVLLLTGQFFSFAGSEVVIFELAMEFLERGYSVDIAAPAIGSPLGYLATLKGINIINLDGMIDVQSYDLVWAQHGLLASIKWGELSHAQSRPFIVSSHLSPYAALEGPLHPLEEKLADLIVFNSEETRARFAHEFQTTRQRVFSNACPHTFFRVRSHGNKLQKLTVISNHMPGELDHALRHLSINLGCDVRIIGYGHEQKLVSVDDLLQTDAVITIGKSVQYALASRTPPYVYDIHGGPGWLTAENFEASAKNNFSGRPECRKLNSAEICEELIEGYSGAVDFMNSIDGKVIDRFRLNLFVDEILGMSAEIDNIVLTDHELRICSSIYSLLKIVNEQRVSKFDGYCTQVVHKPASDKYFN